MAITIGRRAFISAFGSATLAWPLAARAQQAGKIARVGVLGPNLDGPITGPGYQIFLAELRKLAFTEGQKIVAEYRRTDAGLPKAFLGANELVAAKAGMHSSPAGRKSRCRLLPRRDPPCRS